MGEIEIKIVELELLRLASKNVWFLCLLDGRGPFFLLPGGRKRASSRTWAADWSVAAKALHHEGLWVSVRSGRKPGGIGELVDTEHELHRIGWGLANHLH